MNRMKSLREEQGISMREAAKRLNMPYTTYVNYEKGEREPNSETLIAIASFYGTSIDYLLGKTSTRSYGNQFTPDARQDLDPLSEDEQSLIKDYRRLSSTGKEYVLQTVAVALQAYSEKNDTSTHLEKAN